MSRYKIAWPASLLIIAALTSLGSQPAIAGLRGKSPFSWTETSSNGKYVFVAISEHTIEELLKMIDERDDWDADERTATKQRIEEIHRRYPVSGMYLNDDADTLLWKYDAWWIDRGFPSLDGQQFVVIGEGAYGNLTHFDIVHIYDRNGLVRKLYEEDFVPMLELIARRLMADNDGWPASHEFHLDPSGKRLAISSDMGDVVQISLVDGRVVNRNVVPNSLAARAAYRVQSITAALTLAIVVSIAFLARSIWLRSLNRNRRSSCATF